MKQKFTSTQSPASLGEIRNMWGRVVEQVTSQGLALGVAAEMPECRSRPAAK
jgi:hypothetical protein